MHGICRLGKVDFRRCPSRKRQGNIIAVRFEFKINFADIAKKHVPFQSNFNERRVFRLQNAVIVRTGVLQSIGYVSRTLCMRKEKTIPFGINKNVFGKFPELGYSNDYGVLNTTDGFMYDDAVSLCFRDDNKITLTVQIIDRYFGNFSAIFSFNGNTATASFTKTAEDFLNEYNGFIIAKAK